MRSTGSRVQGHDNDTGHVIESADNKRQCSYLTARGKLDYHTHILSMYLVATPVELPNRSAPSPNTTQTPSAKRHLLLAI